MARKQKLRKEDRCLYVEQSAATSKLRSQRLVNFKQTTQYHNTKYRNLIGVLLRLDMEIISPEWRIKPRL
jgi:hypothetical protein